VYESKWKCFMDFCKEHDIDTDNISISN
jgi:hypothetical protein